jgi:hypothetical protein
MKTTEASDSGIKTVESYEWRATEARIRLHHET